MDIEACRLLQVAMADVSFSAAKLGKSPRTQKYSEGHRETDRESREELGDTQRRSLTSMIWELIQGLRFSAACPAPKFWNSRVTCSVQILEVTGKWTVSKGLQNSWCMMIYHVSFHYDWFMNDLYFTSTHDGYRGQKIEEFKQFGGSAVRASAPVRSLNIQTTMLFQEQQCDNAKYRQTISVTRYRV